MKFAEHLSAHITPEWRKQYINYEEMKAMIYIAVEESPSAESAEPEEVRRHFANFDEIFFHYCEDELKKINTFFSEKLAEATRKFATLRMELSNSLEAGRKGKTSILSRSRGDVPTRKLQELKLAFSEFYLSLILLQNYQNLNFTGFRKILKKHDKLLSVDLGAKFRAEHVELAHFHTNKDIEQLISETENTVTQDLESGDRQKAMKRLRVPPLGEQQSPWTTFKVGLFSGSFIVLFIAVILSAIFHESTSDNFMTVARLYRGPLLIVQFLFLIGINVYGWRSSGVNHVLIFELDPRNHLSEQHLMELAAILGVVWTLSLLSFLYSPSLSIPPFVNPLSLVFIMIVFTMNPMRTFRHEARFWLLKICGRMIGAPFFRVEFADFWLADQLNSLATVFLDLHFLVCFYYTNSDVLESSEVQMVDYSSDFTYLWTRSVVGCIPAWIRFAQCLRRYRDSKEAFPHLVNAGKYSVTFFVVGFNFMIRLSAAQYKDKWENPYMYLWLAACLINSLYTYTWDIRMDWGLFDRHAGENKFLREEIVYSSTGFYYFAIIEDLVLRFAWAYSFILTEMGLINPEVMLSLTAPLEVFRRFMWNFFRLENEHLNNCGKFRAVRDISIAPIDSSDHTQIIRMMDDENGVINRKPRKKSPKKSTKEEKRALISKDPENTSPDISFRM
ncbi:xenotropic and polytropic retrovirus receptor 1 homolog isoform X2 [Nilaparvata lugens]|uniref:xenotropic and polytropic retrovirus receptor 1 homolog isoform X2 n=1 Tax=Nilaparvata lugens TaxID=108931 RepID=UPI00193CB878|nr:xenotropic and polytropic retrovirus receptor 1 homolog isoform X2 [Nilaparvata lugens]